ncbi:MAG: alkaline phosphatase family protein, partial [Candidatus Cloacimonadales bacterium]|nr:alkaline phosphatase family protein [Candidatus Cloacimonadales bacterium]
TIDDEIFDAAMKYIQDEKKLFILVHFHSVDDMNHEYGPYSQESMNQLKTIFEYTQTLIDTFVGQVIIFSDHGAHSYLNQGGTHGSAKAEDIVGVVKYVEKD